MRRQAAAPTDLVVHHALLLAASHRAPSWAIAVGQIHATVRYASTAGRQGTTKKAATAKPNPGDNDDAKKKKDGGGEGAAKPSHRLLAIGDVHGDFDKLRQALASVGMIDHKTMKWTGGNATLVQTGDLIDRGHQDKQVLDLMMQLQQAAPKDGGKVVVLIGNHEDMVTGGDERYVAGESMAAFGGLDARRAAFRPDGVYGKWINEMPLIHLERGTVFAHGFLAPKHLDASFIKTNWKDAQSHSRSPLMPPPELSGDVVESKLESDPLVRVSVLNALYGWYRQQPEEATSEDQVARALMRVTSDVVWRRPLEDTVHDEPDVLTTLSLLQADRMVVGHTPLADTVKPLFSDKLFIIDVAMSRWMRDHPPSVLEIHPGEKEKAPTRVSIVQLAKDGTLLKQKS